jgi:UDP-N-acetylglucosamine:LPS N-acetylglucosamine transferase
MKVCVVSSSGGHLTEIKSFYNIYKKYDYHYVLNYKVDLSQDMIGRTNFITHSERDLKLLINFVEAFKLIKKNKPDVILSTGAGPVVPFAIVGKLFYGCKVVFVETITAVEKPSLTGKIMYLLSDHFYYQWPSLKKYFPKGVYSGPLI